MPEFSFDTSIEAQFGLAAELFIPVLLEQLLGGCLDVQGVGRVGGGLDVLSVGSMCGSREMGD